MSKTQVVAKELSAVEATDVATSDESEQATTAKHDIISAFPES